MTDLERLGVEVRTEVASSPRLARRASRSAANRSDAETVLWAAGVAASPLGATLGVPLDRAGRVMVEPDLTIPGAPNVFVIGDLASLAGADGKPLPGVAQVAIQMGQHAVAQHPARDRATAAAAVPLPRSRQHGDDRPGVGGGRLRAVPAERLHRPGWRGSSSTSST